MGLRKRFWLAFAGVPRGRLGGLGARWMARLNERGNYGELAAILAVQPDEDVLDVGCGSAVLLSSYVAGARQVAGLDASRLHVDMARQRLADRIASGTAEVVLGDAGSLPWPDGSFAVVTSFNCLKFVPEPRKALGEIHRVLRPGGRAVLTISDRLRNVKLSGTQDAWGQWRWSEADARRLMAEAGFVDVSASLIGKPQFQLVVGRKPA
ncbi:MAG TPA: methyltransferase domain-containing protein [Propionicimonas sp.]